MKVVPPLSPGWLDTKLVEVLCRLLFRLNWIVSDILCWSNIIGLCPIHKMYCQLFLPTSNSLAGICSVWLYNQIKKGSTHIRESNGGHLCQRKFQVSIYGKAGCTWRLSATSVHSRTLHFVTPQSNARSPWTISRKRTANNHWLPSHVAIRFWSLTHNSAFMCSYMIKK